MGAEHEKWPKQDKWSDISRLLCRRLGLPNGSEFRVIYQTSSQYPKGRVQRGNTLYWRKPFGERLRKELKGLSDSATIKTVIETFSGYINLDGLLSKGAKIVAYGPNNEKLENHSQLGTWRNKEGRETEYDRDLRRATEEEVDQTAKEAVGLLRSLEELRDPDVVIRGVLRALKRSYGAPAVNAEIENER